MKTSLIACMGAALIVSTPAIAQPISQREQSQEQRIERGLSDGSLTPAEAARLQQRQREIRRDTVRMRHRHGRGLSRAERLRLERRLDRQSRRIRQLRHNRRHAYVCHWRRHHRYCVARWR